MQNKGLIMAFVMQWFSLFNNLNQWCIQKPKLLHKQTHRHTQQTKKDLLDFLTRVIVALCLPCTTILWLIQCKDIEALIVWFLWESKFPRNSSNSPAKLSHNLMKFTQKLLKTENETFYENTSVYWLIKNETWILTWEHTYI